MTKSEIRRAIDVCNMIATDAEKDINESEGQPFTGKNVHTLLGKQAAAIVGLTNLVKAILEDIDTKKDMEYKVNGLL